MTSRERVSAAFSHREPDRTPIFEYVLLPPVAEQVLGRPFVEYLGGMEPWLALAAEEGFEQTLRAYARGRVEIAARLGHDMICLSPNPVPGAAYSYDPLSEIGAQFTVAAEGDPVERLVRRNAQVARTMLEPPPRDSYLVYDLVREEMQRRDLDLPLLAPAYFHGIWTDSDLMQVMVLEPEVAREHFRLATRRALAAIDDYARIAVDCIGIGGDFAGVRLLISPAAYRQFIVPEVRACARRVREAGARSVNASDGDLWPVIDDFLGGCEVDAYLEIDMSAGMDMARLKSAWGHRITFFGNMDCGRVLSFASPEEIRRVTLAVLDEGWGSGGHVFTASNAITASVPLANYLAMVNAYRERFGMAALAL
jgi:uroporphyrinogen-III decarboxylase